MLIESAITASVGIKGSHLCSNGPIASLMALAATARALRPRKRIKANKEINACSQPSGKVVNHMSLF